MPRGRSIDMLLHMRILSLQLSETCVRRAGMPKASDLRRIQDWQHVVIPLLISCVTGGLDFEAEIMMLLGGLSDVMVLTFEAAKYHRKRGYRRVDNVTGRTRHPAPRRCDVGERGRKRERNWVHQVYWLQPCGV